MQDTSGSSQGVAEPLLAAARQVVQGRAGRTASCLTRSGLTAERHQELSALRDNARGTDFGDKLLAATITLRQLLGAADPLHSVAVLQLTQSDDDLGGGLRADPNKRRGESGGNQLRV